MKTLLKIFGILLLIGAIASIFDVESSSTDTTSKPNKKISNRGINQEGYFKDKRKNRIRTYSFGSSVTKEEIKKHGSKSMHTAGSLTAIYYYPEGASIPRDGISLADNMWNANKSINYFAEEIDYVYKDICLNSKKLFFYY